MFLISRLPMRNTDRNQRGRRFGHLMLAALLAACAGGGPPASQNPIPIPASGTFRAPKKMGSSITHSKMCKCHACSPAECCQGPKEDENAKKCEDDYDFSKPGCGMQVQSCASRCFEEVWRVSQEASCASKRPEICCGA